MGSVSSENKKSEILDRTSGILSFNSPINCNLDFVVSLSSKFQPSSSTTYLRPPMILAFVISSGAKVKNSNTAKLIAFSGIPYA